ncbi:TPA: ThiF family adenylyltransferase [Candidatus Micrarchaeota archaeon]|nr:ThiF family adenylyltransferase [Candidatus Micrarchaeota archaeon]
MSEIYSEKFFRNSGTLKPAEQKRLRESVFCIVGLGGTGGFCFENLLRLGCENFILYDSDRFELSNFNRQILATEEVVDITKVDAAIRRAREVNDSAKIKKLAAFGSKTSKEISGCDIVIDGTDNIPARFGVAEACMKHGKPYVFCSAASSRGIVSVFNDYPFAKAFQLPSDPKELEKQKACSSVVCPAASLAGTIGASQAANCILGKPYAKAPEAIFFDIFREDVFWRATLG